TNTSTVSTVTSPTPTTASAHYITPTLGLSNSQVNKPSTPVSQIVNLKNNDVISGTTALVLQGEENAAIDLQLQPTNGEIGAIFLGQTIIKSGTSQTIFAWDTTSTPNG